jgi:GNAT superfamily N-acetyltransferase
MAVVVRQLAESDLPEADRIFRLAFGTFLGLPEPLQFGGDGDYVRTRWRARPEGALAAEVDGALAGSNFAFAWGRFGCFGPVSVRPDFWDRGVARALLGPTMELFARWGVTHAGFFTFAHSAKHIALYGKYGFHPRFLTAIMARPVSPPSTTATWSRFSMLPESDRAECLDRCRRLTATLHECLDLEHEIRAVTAQGLGDTILVGDRDDLRGFAVCHAGAGTEAGSDTCYVKFGSVPVGAHADQNFGALLDACESYAAASGARRLVAGTNLARERAYHQLVARGYRTEFQGVAMHRDNDPIYNRPEVFALDDWR